jgi:RNA-directed DNA polymerase
MIDDDLPFFAGSGSRHDPTFADLCAWENLWLANQKAARGKRGLQAAATFDHQLADHLLALQQDLQSRSYRPGGYRSFVIHEAKRRKISAAPFRDRVVHHALCNLIAPLFEARFIEHSFANRVAKGTHAAINQLQRTCRQHRYVLRIDIVEHFPSMDHATLRRQLRKVVRDDGLRWLIDLVLASGEGVLADEYTPVYFPGDTLLDANRPRGLPIGNLTSQFFSNVYLNELDWFIKRTLRCETYLRYVDDMALFSDSKAELWRWREAIIDKLAMLRLTLHEREAQVTPVTQGIPWLGFVVHATHRMLKRRNVVDFSRRLRRNLRDYADGAISFAELDASVQGWIAHVGYADTWGLRQHIFESHTIPHKK